MTERIRSAGPPNNQQDNQKRDPDMTMTLDDEELELIANSLSITVSTQARKIQRLPQGLVAAAGRELDANEALLRRIRDEQRARRQT